MISLENEDIDNLERINGGIFGTVYKKDDTTAYKIYHDEVKNISGSPMINPALTTNKLHYKLLLSRRDKIKKSDLIKDLIYINGRFKGVAIQYYNGPTISRSTIPFKDKIRIARILIDKSKELNNNLIYPTDYKTNNILIENNDPKLIDLDDPRTHAFIYPSPLFRKCSIRAMGDTIEDMLGQYNHLYLDKETYKYITREKVFYPYTYKRIEDYINSKEKEKIIIFIDKDTDIDKLKDNTSIYNFNLVYLVEDNEKDYKRIIDNLKVYNIPLYDIHLKTKIDEYKDMDMIKYEYYFKDKEFKLVYKK